MSDLQSKAETLNQEASFAFFDDLFAGIPLPVTKRPPESFASALPSRVIEMALDDLEAVERLPDRYRVDMYEWHTPVLWKCDVCLAGSVMANRLGVGPSEHVFPPDFEKSIGEGLGALDHFRCGEIEAALATFGLPPCRYFGLPVYVDVADYHDNPAQFKADMHALAAMLKEFGL